jgi:pimeloyl-ACP methyl ester carboxylesterase
VTRVRDVFYLHGFASSPHSTKSAYVGERLRARGVRFECPDFNEPDFATLTITRMLDDVLRWCERVETPGAALIGSSLGAAVAILAARRLGPKIDRLVLLAPAVMFGKPGKHLITPDKVDEWRKQGALPFFHYGYGENRLLNFGFYEDTLRYDVFAAALEQPTLIFQGTRDTAVDYRDVEAFARTRSNVTLTLLDDDHQLLSSLPVIWPQIEGFIFA